ncbi:TetR/AcrR family transcriptional regulator [Massilia sp. TW-1]|uniref:TetR/AcrR family transcriptional regulator n=1 Tax=Telluria antibiotica TaxID=2717319 RepID=A0ABX0P7Z7_9BURK|nr:TetR/AcrR family transcriptional regulator [Telluria antibiotica]NIA52799.1 TetR/AcrR family transcriptional regulator [Telluria antibiotica]
MRYSSNHKAETRQRIIGEAARRFRKHGIEGTGLVPLMKALGLTHGGFYAHFESKDALVQASLEAAAEQTLERWQAPPAAAPTAVPMPEPATPAGDEPVRAVIDDYLSTRHRDEPGEGCPLPTLAAELGLRGQPSATADAMIEHMTALLADCRLAAGPGDGGIVALAAMVGALTLARAVSDRAASDGILATVRAALQPGPREA